MRILPVILELLTAGLLAKATGVSVYENEKHKN
jgi:hypothetical protein